jgi:glycogen debranching enzyme
MGSSSDLAGALKPFVSKAGRFMETTEDYVRQGINPGGHYKAIWCRDASYILRDWFLAGHVEGVMRELMFIWSHQIMAGREKIVYGRGSPEMRYLSHVATIKKEKRFEGALPTTIFHGFSEVYGQDPDIDSTALMISATSWILNAYLKAGLVPASGLLSYTAEPLEARISTAVSDPSIVIDFVLPRMKKAVDYLAGRDIDGDGLLEQGHNEDWMDTVLRAGKIVYSQACWILALSNLASLLTELGKDKDASRIMALANKSIKAVEEKLWLEEEGAYIDLQEEHHIGGSYKTLTQDVVFYLIAVTENTTSEILSIQRDRKKEPTSSDLIKRAGSTLDAIKARIWKERWPLVTEVELKTTGPWVLHPNQYHNHTFWPWTTGAEMLARSRLHRFEECDQLLSILIEGERSDNMLAFYEWVDPITGKGDGASPFRTGVSSIRLAITDILAKIHRTNNNNNHQ